MKFEIEVRDGNVLLGEEALKVLEDARKAQQVVDRLNIKIDEIKDVLLAVMEHNGITKYEDENVTIDYKAPYTRKAVDTKALKDQGLYDTFTVEKNVKASVSLRFKE